MRRSRTERLPQLLVRLPSLACLAFSLLLFPLHGTLSAQQHGAVGMLVERIYGGTTLGVVGQWNPVELGDALGVRFSLGVRAFAGWGDEPGTESARRERRGLSPILYVHLSQPTSATQASLTTGVGYHYHRVSGASDDEIARDPDLLYVRGGRWASHTGLLLVHSRGGLGFFGGVAMGREALGAKDRIGLQLGLGVSIR